MRTIESILGINLSDTQISHLRSAGISNGIGGEGQNVEKILRDNIELLPGFDTEKADRLFYDIYLLSVRHDVEFFFKLGFYRADFRFAKGVYHLLHWSNKRLAIALISFIILNRYGKKFYVTKK